MREKVEELRSQNLGVKEIAWKLGVCTGLVSYYIDPERCGVRAWANIMHQGGMSIPEIAEAMNMHPDTLPVCFENARPKKISEPAGEYIGVLRVDDKYPASVVINGCTVTVGKFDDPISAAWTRDNTIRENKLDCYLSNPKERRRVPR